jgi:hypothetical protein
MTIRAAFPDELSRARSLLNGHPVPPGASFLVGVKEHPVERLVAVIPWWKAPLRNSGKMGIRFHLASSGSSGLTLENLGQVLAQLDLIAQEEDTSSLFADFSLLKKNLLYQQLVERGFEIAQTDRYFSMPGTPVNQRCQKIFQRAKSRMPSSWKVESIREHGAEDVYALVKELGLMSPQQFRQYWDTANRERFEEKYSCVVVEEGRIIGTFLVTQRGADELHIHVDVVSPDYTAFSGLLTIAMRNFTSSASAENFPRVYTSRADSKLHGEGGNTPLRHGGEEHEPRHFLFKSGQTSLTKE